MAGGLAALLSRDRHTRRMQLLFASLFLPLYTSLRLGAPITLPIAPVTPIRVRFVVRWAVLERKA